jgi:hypothetical protein
MSARLDGTLYVVYVILKANMPVLDLVLQSSKFSAIILFVP